MIDTIKAYHLTNDITVLNKLKRFKRQESKKGDKAIIQHDVGGMKFNAIFMHGELVKMEMVGSLTKFYFGNNVQTSTRFTSSRALALLIRMTGIKELRGFKVSRVDFAINVPLKRPVETYIQAFRTPLRYKRKVDRVNSVRFQSRGGNRAIRIYDKIAEARKMNEIEGLSPTELKKNILRFEVMLKYNVKNLNNNNPVTLAAACSPKLYKAYEDKLLKTFTSIKLKSIPVLYNLKASKDFFNYLILRGIEKVGGEDQVLQLIESSLSDKAKIKYVKSEINKRLNDRKLQLKLNDITNELTRNFKLQLTKVGIES
jgi:hypothetical protein